MKKIYMNPVLTVLELTEKQMILAGSTEGFVEEVNETTTIDADKMLSRRGNVWGDEEEEDF